MRQWLLLLHQIPPKPSYFRAKILRRLTQVGALPVKNSAYLLPESEDSREDFEWICREIIGEGGSARLFRTSILEGLSDEQIQESFRQLRTAGYDELIASATGLLEQDATPVERARILHRVEELKKIDFFRHPSRDRLDSLLVQIQDRLQATGSSIAIAPHGRLWVTRQGVRADRIGSAWLIQRFIDPKASFRCVDPSSYQHAEPELRFDMDEGEYTHEGDLCTFEVLIARHNLRALHPALKPMAEIIHDIDLKDDRYQRAETTGLARMLDGLCASTADDRVRLQQGGQIFDALYQSFSA